jgi:hypothetical protein
MGKVNEKKLIKNLIVFIITFSIVGMFICLLKTEYYMNFFYVILGVAAYIFASKYGKEYYLLLCIPEYFISVYFNQTLYNFEYFGEDGLNTFKLHPITIILLIALLIEFTILVYKKKFKLSILPILGFSILIIYSVVTYKNMGQKGFPVLISNYFEPIALFTFYYEIRGEIKNTRLKRVINSFIVVSFFIATYGIIEYVTKYNFFSDVYSSADWYMSQGSDGYRIFTTIGHPLNNAFTFLSAMVVVNLFIKKTSLKNFLLIYFSITILATGSRSMFLLSILLIIFNFNKFQIKNIGKDLIFKIIALISVAVLVFSPLGNTFLQRLDSGTESTEARIILINYFVDNLKSFKINGLTYGNSTLQLKTSDNHNVIPENPYILLFIDLSYLSLLYFVYLFLIIKKVDNKISILIMMVALGTYNSFSVKNTVNSLFFFVIILSFLYKYISANNNYLQGDNI